LDHGLIGSRDRFFKATKAPHENGKLGPIGAFEGEKQFVNVVQPVRSPIQRRLDFLRNLSLSKIRKEVSQRELYFFGGPVLIHSMPTSLVALLVLLRSLIRSRVDLQLENLALRHQLGVLQRSQKKRRKITAMDRLFWASLSRIWRDWRSALVIVKPQTVVAWHRMGFRLFWTWKVRRGLPGRPAIARETRDLIRRMSRENPTCGAPRIHGELLKLGIHIGESSVTKYMLRCLQGISAGLHFVELKVSLRIRDCKRRPFAIVVIPKDDPGLLQRLPGIESHNGSRNYAFLSVLSLPFINRLGCLSTSLQINQQQEACD
jgi:hypothetical protein